MSYLKEELYSLVKTDATIFDFVQQSSLDGMWYWDLENPENEWMNQTFWETLGYDPETKAHKAAEWQDIINADDLKTAIENFTLHCENPEHAYDQVVRYRHSDGSTVWIRCKGLAIRDEQGTPIRMLGAHVDITSQKESELRFKEKVDRYDEIVQGSSIGTWEWNSTTGEFRYNAELRKILGLVDSEQLEFPNFLITYIHPEDRDLASNLLAAHLENPLESMSYECRIMPSYGSWIWIKIKGGVVKHANDADGRWMVGTLTDISERKNSQIEIDKLLKRTQAQNERLLNFANMVSHNLRSHSGNLTMLLEAMAIEQPKVVEDDFYKMLKEAVNGLSDTVTNLHEITQIQSSAALMKEEIDLNGFTEKAIGMIRSLAANAGVTIINETQKFIKIFAVPVYLDSIFINLLSNAIKYKSENKESTVIIKSSVSSKGVQVDFIDNGIGIDLDKHGELIFKLNKSINNSKDSRGIGLFLTKSHVEAMDGSLKVSSELNQGSTFSMILPNE